MTDRKYRQRGYQDASGPERQRDDASSRARRPAEPRDPRIARDPKIPNLPGYREVVRCARCGAVTPLPIEAESRCAACGTALRCCAQCTSFDPGAVFECRQKIASRISPKDAANTCTWFAPRVQVERETGSTPQANRGVASARRALDDLFKF